MRYIGISDLIFHVWDPLVEFSAGDRDLSPFALNDSGAY